MAFVFREYLSSLKYCATENTAVVILISNTNGNESEFVVKRSKRLTRVIINVKVLETLTLVRCICSFDL